MKKAKKQAIIGLTCAGLLIALCGSTDKVDPTCNARSIFDNPRAVVINSKAYTPQESSQYLGKNLVKGGFQPVEVTIENNTAHTYSISTASVDLPAASAKEVVSKVSGNGIAKAVGLKVASLVFWPFNIPSAIDTLKTIKSKANLRKDLNAKTLKGEETILPYSIVSRVLYVPAKLFRESFEVKMFDKTSDRMVTIQAQAVKDPASQEVSKPAHKSANRFDRATQP